MKTTKILGFGLVNFIIRFIVGGILYMGIKMDPIGFWYGFLMTVTAGVVAYILLKSVMKPQTTGEALKIAFVWIIIALIIDVLTAEPIVKVSVSSLFSELQTWTRLAVILLIAPFTVSKTIQAYKT